MDSKAIEALARLGITLVRWETGRQYVGCPRCAQQAKHAHNRRARKLAVSIEPDGAVLWFCNNCEWSGASTIIPEHAKRLRERGLDPTLCARLGVHSLPGAIGFHYHALNGQLHNTKIRRGKGDMPWATAGKQLMLWNLSCLADDPAPDEAVIITEGEFDALACVQAGLTRVVSVPNGAQHGEHGFQYLYRNGQSGEPKLSWRSSSRPAAS